MFVTAAIGAWPEPFRSGYGGTAAPTAIWFASGFDSDAEQLQGVLLRLEVQTIEIKKLEDQSPIETADRAPIVIGAWKSLSRNRVLNGLSQNYDRLGLFVKLEEDRLVPLDWSGKEEKEKVTVTQKGDSHFFFDRAGAIVTAKSAFSSDFPIWLVSGTDDDSTRSALRLLIDRPEKIKNRVGVIITGEEIIHAPVP
jgi:hypothetical protein